MAPKVHRYVTQAEVDYLLRIAANVSSQRKRILAEIQDLDARRQELASDLEARDAELAGLETIIPALQKEVKDNG